MSARIAINGLGRIGRAVFRILLDEPGMEVVAVNDLVPAERMAYLLNFDTVYGRLPQRVTAESDALVVGDRRVRVLGERDPARLPWGEIAPDMVLECTGAFTRAEDLEKHLQAGAPRAILSAPAKGEGDLPFVVHGVNEAEGRAISTASCTTNCIAPVIEVFGRRIGLRKAGMTTVHAYTASQGLVDEPNDKPRRGRAAAQNFVPTSTGAAKATLRALPQYAGRFDGAAIRGPVACGSISDLTMIAERETSVEEVNRVFAEEAETERYRGILGVTEEPLVSSDILGDPRASIVDLSMTQVIDGDLVKVMAWYDNEWGYAAQMVREAARRVGTA